VALLIRDDGEGFEIGDKMETFRLELEEI